MNRKDLGRFFGLANQSCTSRLVLILVLFLLAVELTIGEKEAGKREKMWDGTFILLDIKASRFTKVVKMF